MKSENKGSSSSSDPLHTETSPLANSAFRRILVSRLVSAAGSSVGQIALVFGVMSIGGGVAGLSIVFLCTSLASLLALPFAGALCDRHSRRRLVIAANIACFALQGITAWLISTRSGTLFAIGIIAALLSVAKSVIVPATGGLTVEVLPRGTLRRANSYIGMSQNIANMGGSLVGGAVVAICDPATALALDALTFLAAGLIMSPKLSTHDLMEERPTLLSEMREGFHLFARVRWIWISVASLAVANVAAQVGFVLVGPLVIDAHYTDGSKTWGFVMASLSAGLITGGLISLRIAPKSGLVAPTAGLFLLVAPLFGLAFSFPVPLLILAVFGAGAGLEFYGVNWTTALQRKISPTNISKILAVDSAGSSLAYPIGFAASGMVVTAAGTTFTLIGCAGVVTGAVLAALFFGNLNITRSSAPEILTRRSDVGGEQQLEVTGKATVAIGESEHGN
ncbi:MFS transporter [Nocardia gipuzkoensis]